MSVSSIVSTFLTGKTATAAFPPGLSFVGQSVLITGATAGLGLATATHYVKLGASPVYITARTAEKGAAAIQEIENKTGKKGVAQARVLDMDTFAGVQSFVADLKRDIKILDIILLNAGVTAFSYQELAGGWESDLQVNTLSTTLLTLLLIPYMRNVGAQHLAIVGSSTHIKSNVSNFPETEILDFLNDKKNFKDPMAQYGYSKLLVHYASNEIAKLVIIPSGKPNPVLNTICPGMIATSLAREFSSKSFMHKMVVTLFQSIKANGVEEGTRALVLMGKSPPEDNGKFVMPFMTQEQYDSAGAELMTSEKGQKRQAQVWKEIVGILQAKVPEVKDIIKGI